jgi:hypothetical protein
MASINLQGDTSGSISISAPSVAGSNTLTLPATTQTLATQNALGVRNLIINGDMRIAQRGSSLATSSSEGYIIDRYLVGSFNGNTITYSQDTDVPSGYGFTNSMKATNTTGTAASTFESICQRMEGLITSQLDFGSASAKQITLSFWVKSSVTGTYNVGFRNSANNRGYVADYTISSANTWEKKTVTITGDTTGTWLTTNGIGIRTFFILGASAGNSTSPDTWSASANMGSTNLSNTWTTTSGATFYITGVQLEVGDTATPFEHRPYDMELAKCQRYYNRFGYPFKTPNTGRRIGAGQAPLTTTGIVCIPTPVTMRSEPSFDWSGMEVNDISNNQSVTSINTSYQTNGCVTANYNVASGLNINRPCNLRFNSTSSYLAFDSEL